MFALSSCAAIGRPPLQAEVSGLLAAGDVGGAAGKIVSSQARYGSGNDVLFQLDRALILQMAGRYKESILAFEKAKQRTEELYTRSILNELSTWAVNDARAPYRPSAYERAFMNVFQSFNYILTEAPAEALVEARDLDAKFPLGGKGDLRKTRGFEDNGFARFVSGILYEAAGETGSGDALIAYKQALELYDAYYAGQYVPRVLQESLLRLAAASGDTDLAAYRSRFSGARADSASGKAVVYLLESAGFSPVKESGSIPIPVQMDLVAQVAFPFFVKQEYAARSSRLVFVRAGGVAWNIPSELGVDIEDLALRDMEARKAAVIAKALLRPAFKYMIEANQKDVIEKRSGSLAAGIFGILSSVYNIYTEQADVRSWQSLPAQVRVARALVEPGHYRVRVDGLDRSGTVVSSSDKGERDFVAGKIYFIVTRTLR
ncbi:MAG: hypothetical protein WCI27_02835 [Candidatus Omnitrophota bacterium]